MKLINAEHTSYIQYSVEVRRKGLPTTSTGLRSQAWHLHISRSTWENSKLSSVVSFSFQRVNTASSLGWEGVLSSVPVTRNTDNDSKNSWSTSYYINVKVCKSGRRLALWKLCCLLHLWRTVMRNLDHLLQDIEKEGVQLFYLVSGGLILPLLPPWHLLISSSVLYCIPM